MCVADFQEVLKLEPGNKQALNELQKMQIVCFYILLETEVYSSSMFQVPRVRRAAISRTAGVQSDFVEVRSLTD